ncbi:universal stress protein [Paeniglutamicibacter antarcticus]|uniref:Universal stress protein n=1 Tax=Arthrobacter terrae TaxID=2935737 RepID=A0A931CQR4_9MICC|nr:universal stress protein [Arthrobacter terrae]MBG0737858.1 universal stress protein [Arthrobacter terrae]
MTGDQKKTGEVVVVGVSPTSGSRAALEWGADEARQRSAELFAVSAWRVPRPPMAAGTRPPLITAVPDADFTAAEEKLREHVRAVLGDEASITCRLIHGTALNVLLSVSKQATLLVLDAPQRTDFSQSPLLAHRLVYQAQCPVVIMPPDVADQADTPLVRGSKRFGMNVAKSAATAGRPGLHLPPGSGAEPI